VSLRSLTVIASDSGPAEALALRAEPCRARVRGLAVSAIRSVAAMFSAKAR